MKLPLDALLMNAKYYFLSDAHIGCRAVDDSQAHQQRLIRWLHMAAKDATAIYLLGDIFDFWFEFPNKPPKGFEPLLDTLQSITANGTPIHFLIGNHDLWTFGYLEQRCGLTVHKEAIVETLGNKQFFLAHGDGLGDKSRSFHALRRVFHSNICQWLFRHLIPAKLGWEFGYRWSYNNRLKHMAEDNKFRGEAAEPLVRFVKEDCQRHHYDYYLFGHRHIVLNLMMPNGSQMAILGDFIEAFSYATFDGEQFCIEFFEEEF